MFQVRDPGYSTVWKSKSSSCLQHAAGLVLAAHLCSGATPWAKQGQPGWPHCTPCSSPRHGSQGSPATQISLPQTHLKVATEIKSYVGSSQLLDTNRCWVGRINQLCFHFKMLQLFPWQALSRRVAATHGEINSTPETSLNLSDRGVLTHTLPIHSNGVWEEDKSMTGCPWCGLSSSGDSGTKQVIWSPSAWGSSPAHEIASVLPHLTGLLPWWWIRCRWSTWMHWPMQEHEQRLHPNKTQVPAPEAAALCWLDTRTAHGVRRSPLRRVPNYSECQNARMGKWWQASWDDGLQQLGPIVGKKIENKT